MSWTAGLAADRIRVICGPTAAGKSAIAALLALEHDATILSADSRQIYRGFDIGTAKPNWSERKTIPYEGIDVAEPVERYSASRWASEAGQWIARAHSNRRTSLIAGGTGFYIRALVDPLFDSPEIDSSKRDSLEALLQTHTVKDLRRWCGQLDPARAHLGRVQLTRAIETALLTGARISDLHVTGAGESGFSPVYLVVDPGKALAERIAKRVDAMLDAGWLDEVRALDSHLPETAPAWKASGYRMLRQVARGERDLSSARERIIIETRQYAKRQRTWFRHQLGCAPVTRVDPDAPDCQATVQRWWKESS